MSPAGRRPGRPETQKAILAAARAEFSERGYDAVTLRQIGAAAGVDPSLVYHYFEDKASLFARSIDIPFDPREAIRSAIEEYPDQAGERLVRLFISIWEVAESRAAFLGMLRSTLGGHPHSLEFVRGTLVKTITGSLGKVSSAADVKMRAVGIVSQLMGIAIVRYVARLEPLASATPDEIIELVGPRIQGYID